MAQSFQTILNRKKEQERPKATYFSLPKSTEVKVRFLQELDPDSANFESEKGSALYLVEHVSPHDFRRKAECTYETEGRCLPCELNKTQPTIMIDNKQVNRPWAQRSNMYIYVVTEELDEKGFNLVKVLQRPAPGNFFNQLLNFRDDEGDGSITDHAFKISKGANQNDGWNLSVALKSFDYRVSELVDMETLVGRKIPYNEQASFYMVNSESESSEEVSDIKQTSDTVDW